MQNPRSTNEQSLMPPYPWLLTDTLDLSNTTAKLEVHAMLGAPYHIDIINNAADHARAQAADIAREIEKQGGQTGLADKEIVALVAYLQRLGMDLKREKSGDKPPYIVTSPAPSAGAAPANGAPL
jgi:cytochrome c oxidase cbb3-type subunit I/II